MANPEHIAKLKEGVEAWNEWRQANPQRSPDLRHADLFSVNLIGVDLSGADLRFINLRGANLSQSNMRHALLGSAELGDADLSHADLGDADLSHANLGNADLSGARLSGARLSEANISFAKLRGAKLGFAVLGGANLGYADLSHAVLDGSNLIAANLHQSNLVAATFVGAMAGATSWGAVDLSQAQGLEQMRHHSASPVPTEMFRISKGRIPEVFLRGCGLADWEIENAKLYEPSLREDERTTIVYEVLRLQLRQPIMFHSVFISYSTADEEFATKLYDDFQKAGVRCWFAPHDIAGGKKLHEQIDRAIQVQDRLLLILSEASMASEWVKTELANARAKEYEQKRQVLFPIALIPFDEIRKWKAFDADIGKDSAREVREYFIPDFSKWKAEKAYRPAFERLLKELRAQDQQLGKLAGVPE